MNIFNIMIVYLILLSVFFILWGGLKSNKLVATLGMGQFVALMIIVGVMHLL